MEPCLGGGLEPVAVVVSDPLVVVIAAAASTPDEELGTNVIEECTCEDEV